ncbi:MAG TPA: aldo/keto reductase [Candidatus Omnitrophota bacterium]|nr:aldo/keto reductase [Candidatus Omnitrophota bacterium]
MKYRVLGRTGLRVSEVGLGTWPISGAGYGRTDDAESLRVIETALDRGVNFFDTADIYGNGHSEELLGKVLLGRRESAVLAGKAGWDFYHGGVRRNFQPEYLEFACEQSLKRLGTDVIDVYQLHNPRPEDLSSGEVFDALEKLKRKGKIRFAGISVHTAEEGIQAIASGKMDVLQVVYNAIDQRAAFELFPFARQNHIGVIAREPFACGLLTGKYTREVRFEGPDHRRRWRREKIIRDLENLEKILSALPARPPSLPLFSLQFVLGNPAVSTVIPGAKNVSQVLENTKVTETDDFSEKDLETLRAVYENNPSFREDLFRN